MNEDKLHELEKLFQKDRYVALSGIKIEEVGDDYATVGAAVRPDEHMNGVGTVQGGMLYTAADFAFAVLTNMLHPTTVTQTATVTYIRAAKTDRISATARELACSGHNCVVEVVVKDADGEIVCTGSFNGFISGKKE